MSVHKLYNTITITIIFISNMIFGQSYIDNLKFKPIAENVSQRAITSIIKDQKGIMWIGTQGDGIYSFNEGLTPITIKIQRVEIFKGNIVN